METVTTINLSIFTLLTASREFAGPQAPILLPYRFDKNPLKYENGMVSWQGAGGPLFGVPGNPAVHGAARATVALKKSYGDQVVRGGCLWIFGMASLVDHPQKTNRPTQTKTKAEPRKKTTTQHRTWKRSFLGKIFQTSIFWLPAVSVPGVEHNTKFTLWM